MATVEFFFVVRYSFRYALCAIIYMVYVISCMVNVVSSNNSENYLKYSTYIKNAAIAEIKRRSLNIVSLAGNLRNLASRLENVCGSNKREGHDTSLYGNTTQFIRKKYVDVMLRCFFQVS